MCLITKYACAKELPFPPIYAQTPTRERASHPAQAWDWGRQGCSWFCCVIWDFAFQSFHAVHSKMADATDRSCSLRQDPWWGTLLSLQLSKGRSGEELVQTPRGVSDQLLLLVWLPRRSVLLSSPNSFGSVSFYVWASVKTMFQKGSKEAWQQWEKLQLLANSPDHLQNTNATPTWHRHQLTVAGKMYFLP